MFFFAKQTNTCLTSATSSFVLASFVRSKFAFLLPSSLRSSPSTIFSSVLPLSAAVEPALPLTVPVEIVPFADCGVEVFSFDEAISLFDAEDKIVDTHFGWSCTVDTDELMRGVVIPMDEVEIVWTWLGTGVDVVIGRFDDENSDEVEDIADDDIGTGRVLAPASQSLASSFSASRVTSASLAEIASIAVRLLPLPEASSVSDILEK